MKKDEYITRIKEKLCYYDPRNPLFDFWCDEEPLPKPRQKDCACDNCFYGKDWLANELLTFQQRVI